VGGEDARENLKVDLLLGGERARSATTGF